MPNDHTLPALEADMPDPTARPVLDMQVAIDAARLAGIRAAQAEGRRFTADDGDFRAAIDAFLLVGKAAGVLTVVEG